METYMSEVEKYVLISRQSGRWAKNVRKIKPKK